jgi:zinc transport system substrate-binding protein
MREMQLGAPGLRVGERREEAMRRIAAITALLCMIQSAPAPSANSEKRGLAQAERSGDVPVPAFPNSDAPLRAFVSILPQKQLVERIGGARVQIETLVNPGQNPHSFAPSPKQLARLAKAEVFFAAGVEFEKALLPKIRSSMGRLAIVDACKGLPELRVEHEADGDHDEHGELDPHVWLNPLNLMIQARTVRDALSELDPAGASQYEANCSQFIGELQETHEAIQKTLAPLKGSTIFVYHPAFGHFANAYGLKQEAVETGGKNPGPKHLANLIQQARAEGVKVIFVQPQFDKASAQAIAKAIGGAVVPLDPLAEDTIGNLKDMAEKIAAALTPEQSEGSPHAK